MAHLITMPKFGLTMTEGNILNWTKDVGDEVKSGEPLFEVETDKITNQVEAPVDGLLRHIFIREGDDIACGARIAIIAGKDEDIQSLLGEVKEPFIEEMEEEQVIPQQELEDNNVTNEIIQLTEYIRATPRAKKVAMEQKIDLKDVKGSGLNGILLAKDIKQDSRTSDQVDPIFESKQITGIRKAISSRMTKSWREIPHVTLSREMDVTETLAALDVLKSLSQETGQKITLTHLLIKMVGATLPHYPSLNAWFKEEELILHHRVNIGVATSIANGLLVPVIQDVGSKDLTQIAKSLSQMVQAAQENQLEAADLEGGTFTISNLGMYGIDAFTPIINQPQTGILGIGRIVERPTFQGEQLVKRSFSTFSLSFDHRALDGAEAAQFLMTLDHYIQQPLRLLLGGTQS